MNVATLAHIGEVWGIFPILTGIIAALIYLGTRAIMGCLGRESFWQKAPKILLLSSAAYVQSSPGANSRGNGNGAANQCRPIANVVQPAGRSVTGRLSAHVRRECGAGGRRGRHQRRLRNCVLCSTRGCNCRSLLLHRGYSRIHYPDGGRSSCCDVVAERIPNGAEGRAHQNSGGTGCHAAIRRDPFFPRLQVDRARLIAAFARSSCRCGPTGLRRDRIFPPIPRLGRRVASSPLSQCPS